MNDKFVQFEFDGELQLVAEDEQDRNNPTSESADFSSSDKKEKYNGPERRRNQRRQCNDRREQIRYETGKVDRRSGNDQRKHGWEWELTL